MVIPVRRDGDGLCLAVTDPHDGALREQLEMFLQEPVHYVVSAKTDIWSRSSGTSRAAK